MNILLGIFAILGLLVAHKEIKRKVEETRKKSIENNEKTSTEIISESFLLFISIFELIRIGIHIFN